MAILGAGTFSHSGIRPFSRSLMQCVLSCQLTRITFISMLYEGWIPKRDSTYYVRVASSSNAPTKRCTVRGETRYDKNRTLYMRPCAPRHRKRRNHVGWAMVMNVLLYQYTIPLHGICMSTLSLPCLPTPGMTSTDLITVQ